MGTRSDLIPVLWGQRQPAWSLELCPGQPELQDSLSYTKKPCLEGRREERRGGEDRNGEERTVEERGGEGRGMEQKGGEGKGGERRKLKSHTYGGSHNLAVRKQVTAATVPNPSPQGPLSKS